MLELWRNLTHMFPAASVGVLFKQRQKITDFVRKAYL